MDRSMDTEIESLLEKEAKRQQDTLTLIPSENYCSKEVRNAVGSVAANKYAEGYPGKRYYNGNAIIDEIENLAVNRAKKLFGVPHANVQPYSGSPANSAVYMALLQPGDTLTGLKLSGGGHLTHGHFVTFSGKFYHSVQYDVEEDGTIDLEKVTKMVQEEKPKLIVVGTTAYPRIFDWKRWAQIADSTGAYLLADISHIVGLVVAGIHPSPVPYADVIMTTTHKTLRGPRGAMILVTEKGMKKNPEMAKAIDRAVFPGLQGGPHENTIAGIVVALHEAESKEFTAYGKQIVANAQALAKTLSSSGIPLVTGGTDNHLMVADLRKYKRTGREVADELESIGIVVNRNSIPHDPESPFHPSGIRLGTPAVTTRGMKEKEMETIGTIIATCIQGGKTSAMAKTIDALCSRFPVPS